MEMRTNAISWNPMEAFHFTAANEVFVLHLAPLMCQDNNLYTFDIRRLDKALNVSMDFTSAGWGVMCGVSPDEQ